MQTAARARVLLAALAVVVFLPARAPAKKEPRTPCRTGRYLAAAAPVGAGQGRVDLQTLVLGTDGVSLPGVCGVVRVESLRVRRNGTTLLRAVWPAGACEGLRGRVRLMASLTDGCAALTGSVRAKRFNRRLRARLSVCGDARTDGGAGEQCDPPASPGCNASCQLVPATTTTTTGPAATTTTTTTGPAATTSTTTVPRLDAWQPATVPYDPECSGCQRVGSVTRMPHLGGDLVIDVNPAIDDPIAQWGTCLESVVACVRADGDLRVCVEASACPAECKALFAASAASVAPGPRLGEVFEETFLARTAPCRPAEEGRP